jgi:hypothetical protein
MRNSAPHAGLHSACPSTHEATAMSPADLRAHAQRAYKGELQMHLSPAQELVRIEWHR